MSDWPILLRYAVTAIVFALTIWAFSTGHMLLAVLGIGACIFVFQRFFLSDI